MGFDYCICDFCGENYPEDTCERGTLDGYGNINLCLNCGKNRDDPDNYINTSKLPEPYIINPCASPVCNYCEGDGCKPFILTESGKRKLNERVEIELVKWKRRKQVLE